MNGKKRLKNLKNHISNFNSVGIDTNVFIYYFEQNPEFGAAAKKIFDALCNHTKGVTSIAALIEILSPKFLSNTAARKIEEKFYEIPNLAILEINREIGIQAAEIRREYGFKLPDAVQLATALSVKAKAFITNDQRLKTFKKLKIISLSDLA